jgi:acetyl esterase/lipase
MNNRRGFVFLFTVVWLPLMSLSQGITTLDTIYTPPGYPDGPLAATVFIPDPGNARDAGVILARYTNATRLTAKVWCDTLAARGYLAMTIDYGNLDTSGYPKPQRAFKTAVEFLRLHAGRFGVATERIFGLGQSQGALIWGQTMIWDNDDVFFGTNPLVNDRLDGAILLYGAYDMFNNLLSIQNDILTSHFSGDPPQRGTKGQCLSNVSNITTPALILHGTNDQVVNITHSRKLRDSLLANGKQVTSIEMNGAPHVFDLTGSGSFTSSGLEAKDAVLSFLEGLTSVEEAGGSRPTAFELTQNYPNPFNPSTTIGFKVQVSGFTSLKIFDLLGQEVATLVNEEMRPGSYEVSWDAAGFPSGVYFYRIQTNEITETRRLLLLR